MCAVLCVCAYALYLTSWHKILYFLYLHVKLYNLYFINIISTLKIECQVLMMQLHLNPRFNLQHQTHKIIEENYQLIFRRVTIFCRSIDLFSCFLTCFDRFYIIYQAYNLWSFLYNLCIIFSTSPFDYLPSIYLYSIIIFTMNQSSFSLTNNF